MAPRVIVTPRMWRLGLRTFRAAWATACFGSQFFGPAPLPVVVLAGGFLLYSLLAFRRPRTPAPRMALLALSCETLFFLLFATYGWDPRFWLAALFYLYLLLATAIRHNWDEVFLVAGLCAVYFALVPSAAAGQLRHTVLVGGLLACTLAYQRRRLQIRLARAARREKVLRERIQNLRQTERQRIAGDIHDGPLQSFIGLQVRLEILRTVLSRDFNHGMEELREIMGLLKTQIADFRSFLRTMRPSEPEGTDLMAWMRRVVEEFQKDTGIPAQFSSADADISAPPETGRELLQILREALHNVQKHSRAARVAVSVDRRGRALELLVDDDGSGFSFSGIYTLDELETLRLGPQSIERRVRELGGEMLLESRPGRGAGLKIRVPA